MALESTLEHRHDLSRRRFLAGTAVVGATALPGCVGNTDVALTTGSRGETFTVAPGTVLHVAAHDGDVRVVRNAPGNDKLVVQSRIATTGLGDAFDRARIETDAQEGRFVVRAVVDPSDAPFAPSVVHDVNVLVPDGVTVERVVAENGDVHVSGVDGVVKAESRNGDVTARNVRGVSRADTGNGNVDVTLEAVQADSEYRTANGTVVVRVDADVAADLDLRTGNGRVSVQDVAVDRSVDTRTRVTGRLGAGGPRIDAHTGNGDVVLRAR